MLSGLLENQALDELLVLISLLITRRCDEQHPPIGASLVRIILVSVLNSMPQYPLSPTSNQNPQPLPKRMTLLFTTSNPLSQRSENEDQRTSIEWLNSNSHFKQGNLHNTLNPQNELVIERAFGFCTRYPHLCCVSRGTYVCRSGSNGWMINLSCTIRAQILDSDNDSKVGMATRSP